MALSMFSFFHFQLYFQQCSSDHISENMMENACRLFANTEGGKCCVMKATFANGKIG